jgi:hypothetical protein
MEVAQTAFDKKDYGLAQSGATNSENGRFPITLPKRNA